MTLLFSFPEYLDLAKKMQKQLACELGGVTIRNFPDGESFVKINTNVKDRNIILLCGLDNPNNKVMALMFFANVAKELGAKKIGLVTPYLGYMRQDKVFHDGEAVTSNIFAKFLSQHIDWMLTIDPHLHRHKSLSEIYSIPTKALHATDEIALWIKNNVTNPVLIGPDEESKQWVSKVANKIDAPFKILTKVRRGDSDVEVSVPNIKKHINHTPILIDDIISTARTMIETVGHLHKIQMKPPICIAVHAIFAGNSYIQLKNSNVDKIVTCNTIKHISNEIDLSCILSSSIKGEKNLN